MQFNGMKHIFIPRMALLSFVPAEPDLYREYRKWIEGERNEPVSCSLFVIGGKDNNEGYRGYRLVKPGTLGERIIGAE